MLVAINPRRVVGGVSAGLIVVWSVIVILEAGRPLPFGVDYRLYHDAAARWLATGQFYRPAQLAGHYAIYARTDNVLYPPVILWLLVPFVFLPAWLWWAIPLAIVAAVFWYLRPAWWAWPILLAIAAWPRTLEPILYGNPGMWALAALSLGMLWQWPAALVFLKPTFAPFALAGARSRRWWIVFGLGILACVPFGTMWIDYAHVLMNSDGSIGYSLKDYPLMCAPLVARLAATRPTVGTIRFRQLSR